MRLALISLLKVGVVTARAQTYSPKTLGSKWFFKMGNHSFVDEITRDNVKFDGKTYFESLRTYSWGTIDTSYYRTGTDGATYYRDPKSKQESIEIPAQPKPGQSWISSDKAWKYTIVDTSRTFKALQKEFNNCLLIKAEQISGRDKDKLAVYENYYLSGVGYVGSKLEGGLAVWIDSWTIK